MNKLPCVSSLRMIDFNMGNGDIERRKISRDEFL